jgi:hypothetical protein
VGANVVETPYRPVHRTARLAQRRQLALPGDWVTAALIGIVAWLSALLILFVRNAILGLGIGAFGVPAA